MIHVPRKDVPAEETCADVLAGSLVSLELLGVLTEVAAHALSLPGRERVLAAVPAEEPHIALRQLDLVAQLREVISMEGTLGLAGLIPMEGVLLKLRNPAVTLDAEEILAVADVLETAASVQDRLLDLPDRYALLRHEGERLIPLGHVRDRIRAVLDEHGAVKATASPRLMEIRERSRSVRTRIHRILDGVVNDRDLSRIVQEDYVTLRNDRYVILLRPEFKGLLDGIIHDNSRSGASVYVEPLDVVELNNQVASLIDEDREEVLRIFRELTGWIRESLDAIAADYDLLVELDALQARALYASATDSVYPELADGGFRILGGRHPLLLATMGNEVVPMDIIQDASTLATVISGANMGGKTVALKVAGLFPLMVRCGLMVPAREGTSLHFFPRVMADIGDEQDIRGRISTFSGHMLRIKAILESASPGDLVLLDELGSATDPEEGAALAMGIMDELIDRRVRLVITTHLTVLKAYALGRSDAKNVSVEFHPQTMKPTFRLIYDLPGESHAIETAERIGLPPSVLDSARKHMDKAAGGAARLIQALREQLSDVERERSELGRLKAELDAQLQEIQNRRDHVIDEARKEARELLKRAEREISDLQRSLKAGEVKERRRPKEELRRIREQIVVGLGVPLEKVVPLPEIGDQVRITSLGKQGTVVAIQERGQVEVAVGKMKIRAAAEDLEIPVSRFREKNASKKEKIRVDIPVTTPRREVNVIGLRAEEALPVVDRAVDDAILAGLSAVIIIHGKGTGRLKQAIREHLAGHSLVRGLHPGDIHTGGEGVTVVDLAVD
ncbi:MAG: Smr/MutS family protein [Desulfomonile sp.]|nr:Smr/MutS family protein [Desulfomonile sp.]